MAPVLEEPAIGRLDALAQPDAVAPAERVEARDVEELLRRAVGLGRVENEGRAGVDDVAHHLRELADGQVLAGADVHVLGRVVAAHEEEAGVGEVVHVQELAARGAGAPDRDLRPALGLRVVELPDEGGQHVRAREVEVVVRPVEVRGHGGDEVGAVLLPVGLAELDPRDLGDRVGLVRGLEGAGEEVLLLHRLRAVAGVDAGAAEVEQPLHREEVGGVHHGGVDHHVVVDELGGPRGVGEDAPHRPRHQEDVLRPGRPEPVVDRRLVAQVELLPGRGRDAGEALRVEPPRDGRPHQAPVPGHEDARVGAHLDHAAPILAQPSAGRRPRAKRTRPTTASRSEASRGSRGGRTVSEPSPVSCWTSLMSWTNFGTVSSRKRGRNQS